MRVLYFSSIFPRPASPNRGIYCYHWCHSLTAAGHEVRVVSPRSWLDRRREPPAAGVLPGLASLSVDYPDYYYPPGVLRNTHGWFMWASAKRDLRRAVREFSPECVVSYWIHPDGEVAVRLAREANIPSAVIVGGSDLL